MARRRSATLTPSPKARPLVSYRPSQRVHFILWDFADMFRSSEDEPPAKKAKVVESADEPAEEVEA